MKWLRSIFLLLALQANAATWYVDHAATGATNGTSWVNAVTNFTTLPWASIAPGDDISVSKGTYDSMVIQASGTSNAPIRIHLAPYDGGTHWGHVYLAGLLKYTGYNWITVDGSFDTNFVPPVPVAAMFGITNNIGLHIWKSWSGGIFTSSTNIGCTFKYIDINNCGHYVQGNEHGVYWGDNQDTVEVAYCWIHDSIFGYTIGYNSSNNPRFGKTLIHDCWLENTGDDMFHVEQGTDMFRNLIDHHTKGYAHTHCDALQSWDNFYRFHHNIVLDFAEVGNPAAYTSITYTQMSVTNNGNYLVYDNLIYSDSTNYLQSPGIVFTCDAYNLRTPGGYIPLHTLTNIVIANNLISLPNASPVGFVLYGIATGDPAGITSRGTNVAFAITNCLFVNNEFIDCYDWPGDVQANFPLFSLPGPASNAPPFNPGDPPSVYMDTNSMPFVGNVVAGVNSKIYYMGATNNAFGFNAQFGFTNNSTNFPAFSNYLTLSPTGVTTNRQDFHLSGADTVARDKGYNLDAYTNSMPMLNVDLDGNPREYNGVWDIGPYEYGPWPDRFTPWLSYNYTNPTPPGPSLLPIGYGYTPNPYDGLKILDLDFIDPDWLTNSGEAYIYDHSGYTNHAWEFGHGGQTNWPTKILRGTNQAAHFVEFPDPPIPTTGVSGAYAGVTNLATFGVTTQLTVMLWSYFDASVGNTNGSWVNNASATLLNTGFTATNAWNIGRNGTQSPEVIVWTDQQSGNDYYSYPFNDLLVDTHGLSGWHHYCFTFGLGIITLYLDGTPWSTNNYPAFVGPPLAGTPAIAWPTIGFQGWLGIGVNTHSAQIISTPQFDYLTGGDNYPNNGWMHGGLDKIKIWRSTLSASAVNAIFVAENQGTNPPPPAVFFTPRLYMWPTSVTN